MNKFRLWLAKLFVPAGFQVVESDAILAPRPVRQVNISAIRAEIEKAWRNEDENLFAALKEIGFSPQVLERIKEAKERVRSSSLLSIPIELPTDLE